MIAQLRSHPRKLSAQEVKEMVLRRGFSDIWWNPKGHFSHAYEIQTFNGKRVVMDHATGLMWQQSGSPDPIPWKKAQDYIDQLNRENYAGFSDWRLPTIEELASLLEPARRKGFFVAPLFDITQRWCWSADFCKRKVFFVLPAKWYIDFYNGLIHGSYLRDKNAVRAVRSMISDQ